MIIALQRPKIYADRVKGIVEILKTHVLCASWNTSVTFINDDLLLKSKPHNHPLFVIGFIKE